MMFQKKVFPALLQILYVIFLTTTSIISSYSQTRNIEKNKLTNSVLRDNIKTVRLYKEGWELSSPVMILANNSKLVLTFDELGTKINDYSYTIIHCNSNWEPTDISPDEYIDGYHEGYIKEYRNSFNTTHKYIHYTLQIPNEDMSVKLSGNYCIVVYDSFNKNDIILIKRFCAVENLVTINTRFTRPKKIEHVRSGQEILFSVIHKNFEIIDPFSQLKIVLLQNFRWDSPLAATKPLFIKPGELDYSFDNQFVFDGLSEFREFDTKSMRYYTMYIHEIQFQNPYYHVFLKPDDSRIYSPYFFSNDFNGKFYINIQEGINKNIEADYVYVHFTLNYNPLVIDGDVYVYGELTNWKFSDEYKMEYNFENAQYEKILLLKQGYYNYHYATLKKKDHVIDIPFMEGSHFETENDYHILIYYQDYISNAERIIGYKMMNTLSNE